MKILVKNERAELSVSPDARSGNPVRTDVSEEDVNSEIELLTSSDLLRKVVLACQLEQAAPVGAVPSPDTSSQSVERAVRKLSKNLRITPVHKSNVIQVTYSASTPEGSASVLKELSSAYLDAHLKVHRTAGTREFFGKQAERYQADLKNAEDRMSQFRSTNRLTSVPEQKDLLLRKSVETESQLREADANLAEVQSRIRQLRQKIATQDRRIVTQSRTVPYQYSVERLNTMLAELDNRRTQALMKFQPGDRLVTEINDEIAQTRAALRDSEKLNAVEQSTDINPLRQNFENDLAQAELREAGLKARFDSLSITNGMYRSQLEQLEKNSILNDAMERNVKETEQNYLLYTRKLEEARIADALDEQKIGNVIIAEAPMAEHIPSKPNIPLNLSLGFLMGAFMAVAATFGAEYTSSRFFAPAELEAATGYPVLGTVAYEKAYS